MANPTPETKLYWLIELRETPRPGQYLKHYSYGAIDWTDDAHQAMRFSSRKFAQDFVDGTTVRVYTIDICEHMFGCGTTDDRSEQSQTSLASKEETPPFTVERYGSFGAAIMAENRWLRAALEHVRASAQTGTYEGGVVISFAAFASVREALSGEPASGHGDVSPLLARLRRHLPYLGLYAADVREAIAWIEDACRHNAALQDIARTAVTDAANTARSSLGRLFAVIERILATAEASVAKANHVTVHRQLIVELRAAALSDDPDSAHETSGGWQPIETAPKDGRTLLLGYFNKLGNWRSLHGQWFEQAEMDEWTSDDEGNPAGWYEISVENDDPPNCWSTKPTHWQPTPKPPEKASDPSL